jgi:hypothetical protein
LPPADTCFAPKADLRGWTSDKADAVDPPVNRNSAGGYQRGDPTGARASRPPTH